MGLLKTEEKAVNAVSVVSYVGLTGYLCVYPFFVTNRYFQMTRAKFLFFCGFTVLFGVACLILRRCVKKTLPIGLIRKNRTELYFGIFMALAVVSCVCSDDFLASFSGAAGRYMGLFTFLMIWLAYVFISRFGQLTKTVSVIFGVSVVVMSVIAFLQFIGFDPFGLYVGTKDTVRKTFLALLGNKDVYYSYLSLAVPFALYLSFEARELSDKLFWHGVVFFGFVSVIACNCEGAYICVAVSFVYFFFARCKDRQGLVIFLRNAVLFFAAALLIALTKRNMRQYGEAEGVVMAKLITPLLCGAGLAASSVLCLLATKLPVSEKTIRVLRKTVLCVLLAGAAGVIGAFVYATFIDWKTDIGVFSFFFRYNNKWGSGRGYVWRRMYRIFVKLPFFQKLFGAGEETVAALMQQYFPEETAAAATIYDSSHNEFLQYLVTHGLFGFTAYILFIVSAIKRGFREGGAYRRAAAIAAVGYLAQSAVNITQVLTTPLLFVFLALTQTSDPALPSEKRASANDAAEEEPKSEKDAAETAVAETVPAADVPVA
ncbi:MAG: O-antigen ligase family protein [Clostridia bacterium]|nr:O-antigen ligase family protein [Clostridia bacterium]